MQAVDSARLVDWRASVLELPDWRCDNTSSAGLVWNGTTQNGARALDWFDAVGIAICSDVWCVEITCAWRTDGQRHDDGVITACRRHPSVTFWQAEPSILLKPQSYVTAAALASVYSNFIIL
jgi:hypothetical protein